MAPETGTAILVLVAFVMPGFVTVVLRERSYALPAERTPFELLLNALLYSALIYGFLVTGGWLWGVATEDLVEFYRGQRGLGEYLSLAIVALLALPLLIVQSGVRWQRSRRVRRWVLRLAGVSEVHSTFSGWDQFFGTGQPAFVRVILTDDRVIGGIYDSESLAGYARQSKDLYLQERWVLDADDWFDEPAPNSLGVYISADVLRHVEFYELAHDPLPRRRLFRRFAGLFFQGAIARWTRQRCRRGLAWLCRRLPPTSLLGRLCVWLRVTDPT